MFEEGELLYFEPFIFPDGGTPKNKYFVVLKEMQNDFLLASLPTSKDHVPSDVTYEKGCLEMPERNVNIFVFKAQEPVTSSFSFPLPTFIYGALLRKYPRQSFCQLIASGEIKVRSLGQINETLFRELIDCLRHSAMVKGKYRKLLNS